MDEIRQITQKLLGEFKKVQETILKMREAGYFTEALEIINNISKESFDFDVSVPRKMPVEDLMILLEDHRQLNGFQLNVLAELLMMEGEIYFTIEEFEKSRHCFEKALRIFYHLDERMEEPFSIDLMDRMNQTMEMLQRIKAYLD